MSTDTSLPYPQRFRWVAMAPLMFVAGVAGCSHAPPACDAVDAPTQKQAREALNYPVIERIDLVKNAVPGDPWELVFLISYSDPDGDTGYGQSEVYLNGRAEPARLRNLELFRQSALPFNATSGAFTMPLRFSSVSDGTEVEMGVVLKDKAGHRGNCDSFELAFDVESLND